MVIIPENPGVDCDPDAVSPIARPLVYVPKLVPSTANSPIISKSTRIAKSPEPQANTTVVVYVSSAKIVGRLPTERSGMLGPPGSNTSHVVPPTGVVIAFNANGKECVSSGATPAGSLKVISAVPSQTNRNVFAAHSKRHIWSVPIEPRELSQLIGNPVPSPINIGSIIASICGAQEPKYFQGSLTASERCP